MHSPSVSNSHHARDLPLCIVFNEASGSGDAQRNRWTIQQLLRDAGRAHEFFVVRDPTQLNSFIMRAAERAQQQQGALVVAGGDGTINAVAQAALRTGRPFGIIPQGTFNYSGRAHAIPLEPAAATLALLHAKLKPMQVGLVNDRVFLVNASLGIYPQLLQEREEFKRHFGRYRSVAMLSALATLLHGNGQLTLELEHDGQRECVRTPSLFIGNNALQLEQAGLPEAEDVRKHGQLAGVIVQSQGLLSMLGLIARGARGKLGESDHVRSFPFERMTVRPRIRGVRKLKVALDGEVHWFRPPVVFSVAAQPLQLLAPDSPPNLAASA